MQCQLVEELLETVNDPTQPRYQRGKAALQLSSYSASGSGCKKKFDDVIHYISLSAQFKNSAAQLLCPRVFSTHGKTPDRSRPQIVPFSNLLASGLPIANETGLDTRDDIDMQNFNDDQEPPSDEQSVFMYSPDDRSMDDDRNSTDDDCNLMDEDYNLMDNDCNSKEATDSNDSDSESESPYALYQLSVVFDEDYMSRHGLSKDDYFWMKIRMLERAVGFANQAVKLKFNGQWYGGFDDHSLLSELQSISPSQTVSSIVDLKCQDGTLIHTPLLHHAAACGMFELLKSLVMRGMSPESVNDDGETLLHIAMRHGYSEMVQFLVEYGVRTSAQNGSGVTPLHFLYMFGESGLTEADEDVTTETDEDVTAETQVLDFDGPDIYAIAQSLIHRGADVNASMGEYDSTVDVFFSQRISGTPLHAAVTVGNTKAVEVLLQLGADVNLRPFSNSYTPLELAAQLHLAEIAKILLHHGASLIFGPDTSQWASTWPMHHVGFHILPLTRYVQKQLRSHRESLIIPTDGFFTALNTNQLLTRPSVYC